MTKTITESKIIAVKHHTPVTIAEQMY